MQWRIKESDCNWQTSHFFKDSVEIVFLVRQKFFKGNAAIFFCFRKNHLSYDRQSFFSEKHMFGSAKSYSLCAKFSCFYSILRSISICSDFQFSELIRPFHQFIKFLGKFRFDSRYLSFIDSTSRAIKRKKIT